MNKISIVTICFNNPEELKNTCSSVDKQTEKPFEHIIINGSTKPDIKDYLEQHAQPAYRRWLNERDNGIADAFNKGISLATGDMIVMLNSGDTLYDEHALQKVSAVFNEHSGIQWLHGKYKLQRGEQEVIIGKPFSAAKVYRGMRSISHQTMYVRKELYNKYGLYDTSLPIAMDYDFLLRIKDEPFYFLPEPIATFAPGGISSVQYLKSVNELSKVYRRYSPNSFLHTVWQWRLKFLHYLLQSPVGKSLYKMKVWLKLENL